jgi:hypothetical protein
MRFGADKEHLHPSFYIMYSNPRQGEAPMDSKGLLACASAGAHGATRLVLCLLTGAYVWGRLGRQEI